MKGGEHPLGFSCSNAIAFGKGYFECSAPVADNSTPPMYKTLCIDSSPTVPCTHRRVCVSESKSQPQSNGGTKTWVECRLKTFTPTYAYPKGTLTDTTTPPGCKADVALTPPSP